MGKIMGGLFENENDSQVTKVALQHLKIYIQNNKYVASYLATSFIMSSFR